MWGSMAKMAHLIRLGKAARNWLRADCGDPPVSVWGKVKQNLVAARRNLEFLVGLEGRRPSKQGGEGKRRIGEGSIVRRGAKGERPRKKKGRVELGGG